MCILWFYHLEQFIYENISKMMDPPERMCEQRSPEHFWKPFVRVFQALALSNYSIFRPNPHFGHLLYFVAFSFLHISIIFYTLGNIHALEDTNFEGGPLIHSVNIASIFGNFVAHIIVHLEPFLTRRPEEEMNRKFGEIDEIFVTKLNHVMDFERLRRQYIFHTIGFFSFFTVFRLGSPFSHFHWKVAYSSFY